MPKRQAEDMLQLLNSGQLADLKIVASGTEIEAHRNILAARSPVFAAMFSHDMAEQRKNVTIK